MLIDFRTLFPKYKINPKGVLHVGANVCEEAPVYDELGIKNVLWIEANKELFDSFKIGMAITPYSGQYAINACVSDTEGEIVKFNISNNASQSSSILELGTHKVAHPEVHYVKSVEMTTERLDKILDQFEATLPAVKEFDFLNIDLQGAELKALRGLGDKISQFKWAYLEVNKEPLYVGCDLIDSVDLFMLAKGFRRVETQWCGNTGWGDCLMVRD